MFCCITRSFAIRMRSTAMGESENVARGRGFYRIRRGYAPAGNLVTHIGRHIEVQPDERLIEILDFRIDVKFRRVGPGEIAILRQGCFQALP